MLSWKITAQTLAIESGDHAEARCLREIKRITNRDDRRRNFELVGISDRQCRAGQVRFQERDAASEIGHQLASRIFFTLILDVDVFRFASDGIGGVKSPHWVDKKPGTGK